MPRTTEITAIRVGATDIIEARVGTTTVWPFGYTYVISDVTARYTSGKGFITAIGDNATNNYAYFTGTVKVYRGSTLIETRTNELLTVDEVRGGVFYQSGNYIYAPYRGTTTGNARSANVKVSYSGTEYASLMSVTQQENIATLVRDSYTKTKAFYSTLSVDEVNYNGGVVVVSGTRSFTVVSAEYSYTSTAHSGGVEDPTRHEESVTPSVSCSTASVYANEVHVSRRTKVTSTLTHIVNASYDGYSYSRNLYQTGDTIISTSTEYRNWDARLDPSGTSYLTAKGGYFELYAYADHEERTVTTWQSGDTDTSSWSTVNDTADITSSGTGTAYYHLSGSANPYRVDHDNMIKRSSDDVTFTAANHNHSSTTASRSFSVTNGYTTGAYTDEFSLLPDGGDVPAGGGDKLVVCKARKYATRTWDSDYTEQVYEAYNVDLYTSLGSVSPSSMYTTDAVNATVTVPSNPYTYARTITVQIYQTGVGYKATATFRQAFTKPLADYIEVYGTPQSGKTKVTINNTYSVRLYAEIDLYVKDSSGSVYSYDRFSAYIEAGATETRYLNGSAYDGYEFSYTKNDVHL